MPARPSPLWNAVRYCGDVLVTLVCWVIWIALGVLLALQIAVLASREFQVPQFLLRSLEDRFNASHVEARFGRALLDPSGRILLQDLRLSLPGFTEPVVQVRAAYVELDPWPLLLGRLEARRVQATGATLYIPAMVSPSGRTQEGIGQVDFDLITRGQQVDLQSLTGRVAGIAVMAHGQFRLPRLPPEAGVSPVPLVDRLADRYVPITRDLSRAAQRLQALEQPRIHVTLEPSADHWATAEVTLLAESLSLPASHELHARNVHVQARVPLGAGVALPLPFRASIGDVSVAGVEAHQLEISAEGVLATQQFFYDPRRVEFTAGSVAARGFSVRGALGQLATDGLPHLRGTIGVDYDGLPLHLEAEADLAAGTAVVHAAGRVSAEILTPISATLRRDVRTFVDFGEPVRVDLDARFGPGWKFTSLQGNVAARRILAYHVPMDAGGGDITFDGRTFTARHAFVTQGDNVARGTFDQDLRTREFRFLLNGRLRPLDISGWFHEWWTNFFEHFEFPDAPPDASVDVAGRWTAGRETTVFLFAQSGRPTIRGAALDYARTLMFIRPNFFDAQEIHATHGTGELRGSFQLTRNVDQRLLESSHIGFALNSTLDLPTGARLLGPAVTARVAPFQFDRPPELTADGEVTLGSDDQVAERRAIHLVVRSAGRFSAYGVEGENLAFDARLRGDEVTLSQLDARIAGGGVSGQARVWGPPTERRLGFDAYVKNAALGEAISRASEYIGKRRGRPSASADKILSARNNTRFDLAVSAEGLLNNPYSFHGSGNASMSGEELGQVRLLGLLSELVNFTALRFTTARAEFKIDGAKLTFPTVNVTGANSAIHAHGDYSLERHELDFNARVYPFEESRSFLQSVMGAVLTPFSAVLEVRLTGPLDQPAWAFVIGPTNLLYNLTQSTGNPPTPPSNPAVPLKGAERPPMKTD